MTGMTWGDYLSYKARAAAAEAEAAALREALTEARPYVFQVTHEQQPWRNETARGVLKRIDAVLARTEGASA